MLFFDEADALFGKRTEVADSNDRFANAQTNYLLQRIEKFDGIALLTSNSRARFDTAFARRLDAVIEFPLPGPESGGHLARPSRPPPPVSGGDFDRLAGLVDFAGGHIRNIVLAAAVRARAEERKVSFCDLIDSVEAELRKLGRQMPMELKSTDNKTRATTEPMPLPGH